MNRIFFGSRLSFIPYYILSIFSELFPVLMDKMEYPEHYATDKKVKTLRKVVLD
jgi:hypothetical protein